MVRGRPTDPEKAQEQRLKLFSAARELLQEKSYQSITIRELAAAAGINSAMISYHFGNKEGLFLALIEHMGSQHLSQLQQFMTSDNPLKAFIYHMTEFLAENVGLARFIHDEVINDSSSLRETFINGFPKKMATMLPMLIQQYQITGQFRQTLNPKHAAFSLMNLLIMPVIAAPVREHVWNISTDEIKSPEWAEHIYNLFVAGCQKEQ